MWYTVRMRRLNVGCGKDIRPKEEGWDNLDMRAGPGVDIVADITDMVVLEENIYDQIYMSHLIEHLYDPLQAMENLWYMAKPDGIIGILTPHGASDEAWEDQTHVRPYFPGSFLAFGQPYYHLADYQYKGDWEVKGIILEVYEKYQNVIDLDATIREKRNVCRNMYVEMTAIKPARPQEPIPRNIEMAVQLV